MSDLESVPTEGVPDGGTHARGIRRTEQLVIGHEIQLGFGTNEEAALGSAVLRFLEDLKQALDLPLDLRGTAFQRRVWQTLCRLAPGETRSYGDVVSG